MITQLGGLHSNAYISDLFAQNFAKDGMKAYVEIIQRKERELGTDVLTHQKVRPSPTQSLSPLLSIPFTFFSFFIIMSD